MYKNEIITFFSQICHLSCISHLSKRDYQSTQGPKQDDWESFLSPRRLPLSPLDHQIWLLFASCIILELEFFWKPQVFLTRSHADWADTFPNSSAISSSQIYPSHYYHSNHSNHQCSPFLWPGKTPWWTLNCRKDDIQNFSHRIHCLHLTHSSSFSSISNNFISVIVRLEHSKQLIAFPKS